MSEKRHGGARRGSGPAPFAQIIGAPGAAYLRELTRARLGRRDVTRDECAETLRGALAHWAMHHHGDDAGMREAIERTEW
jgi:hypothetical protein